MSRKPSRSLLLGAALVLVTGLVGCHRHTHAPPDLSVSQEPDKILYEKSLEDIQNKRYDVARLTLQTLINTYSDSDYLAKAKLAIADSYYEEGGAGPLTHAEVEYKDFITFFPNAPEVALAQYRAAMCHYRQLEKPDRDPTHARRAEREFQLLLLQYPASDYAADGEKKLIQVQEVLAEGEYRVGRFYYIKKAWRAAAARLAPLVERYPNYSQRDAALWMLGQIFQKQFPPFWPGDLERAAGYYARIVREHPLSDHVADARAALADLSQPIPEPDPELLARAQTIQPVGSGDEGEGEEDGEKRGMLGRLFGILSSRPDTSEAAARLGPPPLQPPKETPPIPPPTFSSMMERMKEESRVAVQTVEEAPAGTVVQTADARTSPGQPQTDNSGENNQGKDPSTKKKSFWRKLVPFM